jgi:hypothetical protein
MVVLNELSQCTLYAGEEDRGQRGGRGKVKRVTHKARANGGEEGVKHKAHGNTYGVSQLYVGEGKGDKAEGRKRPHLFINLWGKMYCRGSRFSCLARHFIIEPPKIFNPLNIITTWLFLLY